MHRRFVDCICSTCGKHFDSSIVDREKPQSACFSCNRSRIIKHKEFTAMEERIAELTKLQKLPVEERIGLIEAELYDLRNKNKR